MDVKQYHRGQRNVDDKAIQRCRRILRKTTRLSQDDSENKAEISNPMFTMACLASAGRVLPVLRTGAD